MSRLQFSGDPLVEVVGWVVHDGGEDAAVVARGEAAALHAFDGVDVFAEDDAPGFEDRVSAGGVFVCQRLVTDVIETQVFD